MVTLEQKIYQIRDKIYDASLHYTGAPHPDTIQQTQKAIDALVERMNAHDYSTLPEIRRKAVKNTLKQGVVPVGLGAIAGAVLGYIIGPEFVVKGASIGGFVGSLLAIKQLPDLESMYAIVDTIQTQYRIKNAPDAEQHAVNP